MSAIKPFPCPIYITRPLLPDLHNVTKRLQEVWDSEWLSNNAHQHQLLEQRLKEVLKVPNLSLFNNGTTGLSVACRSLDLSGEVITTPFTFPATCHVLTWNGIRPVFCDIDPSTMNIDAKKIGSMITSETTGILGVHAFGTPCDVDTIQELADTHGLKVIYDSAHAFQTEVSGVGIGNFGDISMFSFHATKLFHTAEGGALVFKDSNLKSRIELLKNFGIKNEEEVVMPGINGKMNEIQAALGLVVLDLLEGERNKRRRLLDTYHACLKDIEGISFLQNRPDVRNSYQYLVIRIDERLFGRSRDFIHEEFKKYNVFTRKYFHPLCSNYAYYHQLPSASVVNLPVANRIGREVLTMPFYGRLLDDDVEKMCNILKSFR